MKIIIAENRAYCSGVKRALGMADQHARIGKVCSLGPLIHNRHAVHELEIKGIKVVEELGDVDGEVLIRTHGVDPAVFKEIKKRKLEYFDLTCPNVAKAQRYAQLLNEQGYEVVIVGEANHPEVKGLLGFTQGKGKVFRLGMRVGQKVGIVAQTTSDPDYLLSAVNYLLSRTNEIKIFNTICAETLRRRLEAISIANNVSTIMVIGGKNSANTSRLAEVCSRYVRTFHIEDADELTEEMLDGSESVGVVSGTSTPEWVIDQVIKKLKERRYSGNEKK